MALIALGLQRARRAQGRCGGGDGDVEPRPRAEARRRGPEAAAHQGRRPLCARGDAQERLQRRRRAVGAHHPRRPCDHRRRARRRACRCLPRWSRRERRRASSCASSSRSRSCSRTCASTAAPSRSKADSVQKRIAAAEAELEGRGRLVIRKSGTEPLIRVMAEGDDAALVRARGRRHLRGRSVGRVNALFVIVGQTTLSCAWRTSPREAGRRRIR